MARKAPNRKQAGQRRALRQGGLRGLLPQGGLAAALLLLLVVVIVFFALGYLVGRLFL
jgi:hypothetical protein